MQFIYVCVIAYDLPYDLLLRDLTVTANWFLNNRRHVPGYPNYFRSMIEARAYEAHTDVCVVP